MPPLWAAVADTDHALDPIPWLVTLPRHYGLHNLIKFTIAEPWGAWQAKTDSNFLGLPRAGGFAPRAARSPQDIYLS
jgi:hypothetical protein